LRTHAPQQNSASKTIRLQQHYLAVTSVHLGELVKDVP
jgi:hypothetical protein